MCVYNLTQQTMACPSYVGESDPPVYVAVWGVDAERKAMVTTCLPQLISVISGGGGCSCVTIF